MTTYYLVRHGEADYSKVVEYNFYGFGWDFAPLSLNGINQAEDAAKDPRLKSADIILSSPYTRALQTAQIISRNTGIEVRVEIGLHEWIPDLTNQYTSSEEAFSLTREFNQYRGVYPENQKMKWECLSGIRVRMKMVVEKYTDFNKVILVSHGMALRSLAYIEQMKPAEIIEWQYSIGQRDCEYSFC